MTQIRLNIKVNYIHYLNLQNSAHKKQKNALSKDHHCNPTKIKKKWNLIYLAFKNRNYSDHDAEMLPSSKQEDEIFNQIMITNKASQKLGNLHCYWCCHYFCLFYFNWNCGNQLPELQVYVLLIDGTNVHLKQKVNGVVFLPYIKFIGRFEFSKNEVKRSVSPRQFRC